VLGLDLLDFFRGRYTWRKLLDLIRRLPSTSRFTEAMANDDDYAEAVGEPPANSGPAGPRVSEYTPEVARLDVLIDRMGELISTTLQVHKYKAPRVRPAIRPETAFSRAAKRRTEQSLGSLIAEVEAAQQRAATNN
jgi:hypothetical protein